MSRPAQSLLGLWSGVGLVSANMIGAGVFLSAGFMAQSMSPELILVAWLVGMLLALAGARAYAEIATLVPRSGGEYRYLSELLHPALGYVAGWASLLIGFAAPVAINALGAAGFLATVVDLPDQRVVATAIVLWMTLTHSARMSTSRWTQDLLAWLKVFLVAGFVALGLAFGAHTLPDWPRPAGAAWGGVGAFMESQFYIAFAFSGWNAAIYVAEEFRDPRRDVARSMLIGCVGVGALYLLVNFVLVANVTPQQATVVFEYEETRTTLGHVVASTLMGEIGGTLMSLFAVVAFVSATSAMTFVGPRVCAAMARDGFLPAGLAGVEGRPPIGAVLLQGAVAIAIMWAHGLHGALQTVGAVLTLFAALTCIALFKLALTSRGQPRPAAISLVSAAIYVAAAAWMLYFGFKDDLALVLWIGAAVGCALASYVVTRRRGR